MYTSWKEIIVIIAVLFALIRKGKEYWIDIDLEY